MNNPGCRKCGFLICDHEPTKAVQFGFDLRLKIIRKTTTNTMGYLLDLEEAKNIYQELKRIHEEERMALAILSLEIEKRQKLA